MKTFETPCHEQIGTPVVVDFMATGLVTLESIVRLWK